MQTGRSHSWTAEESHHTLCLIKSGPNDHWREISCSFAWMKRKWRRGRGAGGGGEGRLLPSSSTPPTPPHPFLVKSLPYFSVAPSILFSDNSQDLVLSLSLSFGMKWAFSYLFLFSLLLLMFMCGGIIDQNGLNFFMHQWPPLYCWLKFIGEPIDVNLTRSLFC